MRNLIIKYGLQNIYPFFLVIYFQAKFYLVEFCDVGLSRVLIVDCINVLLRLPEQLNLDKNAKLLKHF